MVENSVKYAVFPVMTNLETRRMLEVATSTRGGARNNPNTPTYCDMS